MNHEYGIIKSVSIIYLPENEELKRVLQDHLYNLPEETYFCQSLEEFIDHTTTAISEEHSFITCYVEDTEHSIHYIQENILANIESVVVTSYPSTLMFFHNKEKEEYKPPPHIKNIIENTNLVTFISPNDLDLSDDSEVLKFLNDLQKNKSKMQFHLFNSIALYRQNRNIEDCQQAINMIREDLERVFNPECLSVQEKARNFVKIDFKVWTKQLLNDLKKNKFLIGGVDWWLAHLFVYRARYLLMFLTALALLSFSSFKELYKIYYTIELFYKNKTQIERLILREKKRERKMINKGINTKNL